MSGKMLVNRELEISDAGDTALFRNNGLRSGLYRYTLIDQNSKRYRGAFLIK